MQDQAVFVSNSIEAKSRQAYLVPSGCTLTDTSLLMVSRTFVSLASSLKRIYAMAPNRALTAARVR